MNSGSTLQSHIHGKTKAGSPSEGALQARVSQSKALLRRGVVSEALPDAAARSPNPSGAGVRLEPALSRLATAVVAVSNAYAMRLTSPSAFLKPGRNSAHFRNRVYALSGSVNNTLKILRDKKLGVQKE